MSASRERSANTSDSDDEEPLTKAKLFALGDSGQWAEMGVGVAWVAEEDGSEGDGPYMTLNISSIEEKIPGSAAPTAPSTPAATMNAPTGDLLMKTIVMPDEEYKVQRGSILLWSDPRLDGKDMAISFHSRAGCDHIVDSIMRYQQRMRDRAANRSGSSRCAEEAEEGDDEPSHQHPSSTATAASADAKVNNNDAAGSPANRAVRAAAAAAMRQRLGVGSGTNSWAVTKSNLSFLNDALSTSPASRHRFSMEMRERKNFVYDLCSLFVTAVHEGDFASIDYICNIVVGCLTIFSNDVHVITQFVEEKTVEAVIDVVQFHLGRRTNESGFVSRAERQSSFRNPAKLPPWLVSRVHYFFAIQYLRDLLPNKLESPGEGDQSLVNLFLLRARLNMVQELTRRPPPHSPDGAAPQQQGETPARGGTVGAGGSGTVDDEDEDTQNVPPANASSSATKAAPDADRSILETAMLSASSTPERRGVVALLHDVTYSIKFNPAYGIDVRNEVFGSLVKSGALEFLSRALREELVEELSCGPASSSSTLQAHSSSSASASHHSARHPPRGTSSSRASSMPSGSAQHNPTVQLIADVVSHVAVWAPVVVCTWLLEDAKKGAGGPQLPITRHSSFAPPPPLLSREETATPAVHEPQQSLSTPPRSPTTDNAGAAEQEVSAGGITAVEGSRERTVSVSVHPSEENSLEPTTPLSCQQLSTGPNSNANKSAVAEDDSTSSSCVMSPTAACQPGALTVVSNAGPPLREGISPSPMSSSSTSSPADTDISPATPLDRRPTLLAPTPVSGVSRALGFGGGLVGTGSGGQHLVGRSLLFLLVEAVGIVTNSVALQSLVDACVACGIGLVQNSNAPSIFGAEVGALRNRILQYFVTGWSGPSTTIAQPVSPVCVPLYHAMKAAYFYLPHDSDMNDCRKPLEPRTLQALRLLRVLGREKPLVASPFFFNTIVASGLVENIGQYVDACARGLQSHHHNMPPLSCSSSSAKAVAQQVGLKRERSVDGDADAPSSTSTQQPMASLLPNKQVLTAMCGFLVVLISFNNSEVDRLLIQWGVLDSLRQLRKCLRPGGSLVTANLLAVFASIPAAFKESKERPSSSGSSALSEITRSPYVTTIENSQPTVGMSLTSTMEGGSKVLLEYVAEVFGDWLEQEAPHTLKAIYRAIEGKPDDDVCSSVSSTFLGPAGHANQEAFEAELAVLLGDDEHPHSGVSGSNPIPSVLDALTNGVLPDEESNSLGQLSVDDVVNQSSSGENDNEEDDEEGFSSRGSSTTPTSERDKDEGEDTVNEEGLLKDTPVSNEASTCSTPYTDSSIADSASSSTAISVPGTGLESQSSGAQTPVESSPSKPPATPSYKEGASVPEGDGSTTTIEVPNDGHAAGPIAADASNITTSATP